MPDPILSIQNVTVQFGGLKACADISADVERGSLFALIGPNGAGKTTLVNSVTGVYAPAEGARIDFRSRSGETVPLVGLRPFEIARLGVARTFQNLGLFPEETVVTNLLLGRYIHDKTSLVGGGLFTRRAVRTELAARQAIEPVIELLGLGDVRHEAVGGLPYGVQKRIELGRVLVMEPELIMLDEPMAGMGVEEKQDMIRFVYAALDELDMTVFLIEHDMGVVMSIAEQVMVLDFGERIALGTPAEVQEDEQVINAYLGAVLDEL